MRHPADGPTPAAPEEALHRALAAADAANQAKTRYLVAVSHEIRSPLNAIYGYAQLLERDGAVAPAEAGGVIRRAAEHLTNLVEGLLDISRVESGVLTVQRDIVRLPALLDQIVEMFGMQATAKGLTLDYRIDGRLPPFVRTDEKRLRQILINLLSNAIKYTPAGGATLSIAYRSQIATIEVADTGIGIAADDHERIFEPFERGGAAEAALQPGVGLGLALTRALVRILGGEVTVASEPGRGSRFTLRLLLPEPMTPPAAAASTDRITGYRGARRTLLLADDDPAQIAVMQTLLRPLGFTVFSAENAIAALALADHCAPDLALLDIQMPGMDGWALAERLRTAFGRTLRIVMLSANAHEIRAGNDGNSSHDAFVTKPVGLATLLDTIGAQLGLEWIVEGADSETAEEACAPVHLPAAAAPLVDALRGHVRTGHVRAIDATLADIDARVPGAAPAVAAMRRLLDAYDLRGLARMLDDAG